jgi:hypothetical protein
VEQPANPREIYAYGWETKAMTAARAPALALAMVASSALAAQAQTLAGPSDPPQTQWRPTAAQVCQYDLASIRQELEKQAKAATTGSETKATREEKCKLVTAYANAEANWIKYVDDNMVTCGIPTQAVEQLRSAHTRTLDTAKKLCGSGSPWDSPTHKKYMRISGRPQP